MGGGAKYSNTIGLLFTLFIFIIYLDKILRSMAGAIAPLALKLIYS